MEMVVIVHPTLDEYHARVKAMAKKYGQPSWIGLGPADLNREDAFEYSFIISAVGDQLIHREFLDMSWTPDHLSFNDEVFAEPGLPPGSVFFSGVKIECPAVCRAY